MDRFKRALGSSRQWPFLAPLMATVATGIPDGICTIAYKASTPLSAVALIGTPITGKVVTAARTPPKCAAAPAPAMRLRRNTMGNAKVGIVMGSDSDLKIMQDAVKVLREFGIESELVV